jgi:hypothetical protein
MFGLVVVVGGRLWWPQMAAAQAKEPAVAEVVKAPRFEVVVAAGKIRVVLGEVVFGSPNLNFYDAAGKVRVRLDVALVGHPHGNPRLEFHDAAGKQRALLALGKDGNPSLELAGKTGIPRAVLGATSLETVKTAEVTMRPESSLVLFDKDGELMWKAP